jgi:hypothetical protein
MDFMAHPEQTTDTSYARKESVLNLKQPAAGIIATLIGILIALAFISRFDFPTFAGWISYFFLCVIPVQIVMAITWGTQHPQFAAKHTQPLKGLLLLLVALVLGGAIAAVCFETVGGGISPPTPMLAMYAITAVATTFWAAIVLGGWPSTAFIKNPLAAGLGVLLTGHIVCYLLFRIFFNYGFMRGAPVYVASLDPQGLFNAWYSLVFAVATVAAMFLVLLFDLWPLTKFPGVMRQPVLGIVWTLINLALTGIAFYIGVVVMKMDVVAFLVRVPVPFIFGSVVTLNMFQASLFQKLTQPVKGIVTMIFAALIGTLLTQMYGLLAPTVTGTLHSGPPPYDFEIWLASALLSITFPFLVFFAEFFKLWPLKRAD